MGDAEQREGGRNAVVAQLKPIERVVSRVRWRVRAQLALRYALITGAVALLAFATVVLLVKTRVLPGDALTIAGWTATALPLLGLAFGLSRRLDDIALATALDASGALHSRIGSALAFAREPNPTPMQAAAIEDAIGVLNRASPKLAAPWQWGFFAAGAIAAALALAISIPAVFALEFPVAAIDGAGLAAWNGPAKGPTREKTELRKDDQKKLEDLAESLQATETTATDEKIKDFLADLNELVRALKAGALTPEEAHARLAALEKALEEWKKTHEKEADDVAKRLQDAAEKRAKVEKPDADLKPLLEALKKQDMEAAAKAAEKIKEQLEKKELTEAQEKELGKSLEELAKQMKDDRQKDKERLKQERDRLKEKEQQAGAKDKDRLTPKEKDRLKEVERQLEQLKREDEQMAEARRQLEELTRDMDQAAQDMLRRLADEMQGAGQDGQGNGPEDLKRREREGQNEQNGQQNDQGQEGQQGQAGQQAGKEGREGQEGRQGQEGKGRQRLSASDMKKVAEALKKMAQSAQGRQQMRAAEGKMVDLREMMRRAAEQAAQGKGQQGGQGGKDGGGKDGQAQNAWEKFKLGAAGQGQPGGQDGQDGKDGKDGQQLGQGDGKDGKDGQMMLLGPEGDMKGGTSLPMPGRGHGAGNDARVGQNGIGEGHDARLQGEKTTMQVKTVEDFVAGQQGDGDSQSKVIWTAAQKGFTSAQYAEVHQDYAEVVEEKLEAEHVPAGKRSYVRKYFDLIRPR